MGQAEHKLNRKIKDGELQVEIVFDAIKKNVKV